MKASPALAFGKNVLLWGAVQKAVLVLHAREPRCATARRLLRLAQLVGREIRAADLAHLAGPNQLVEGAERLTDRHVRVGGVQLVEVDAVRAQAPEAVLHGSMQVFGPRAPSLLVQPAAKLRG